TLLRQLRWKANLPHNRQLPSSSYAFSLSHAGAVVVSFGPDVWATGSCDFLRLGLVAVSHGISQSHFLITPCFVFERAVDCMDRSRFSAWSPRSPDAYSAHGAASLVDGCRSAPNFAGSTGCSVPALPSTVANS